MFANMKKPKKGTIKQKSEHEFASWEINFIEKRVGLHNKYTLYAHGDTWVNNFYLEINYKKKKSFISKISH